MRGKLAVIIECCHPERRRSRREGPYGSRMPETASENTQAEAAEMEPFRPYCHCIHY